MNIGARIRNTFIILLSLLSQSIFSQKSQGYLRIADSLYKAGDKTKAKDFYQKAASLGNADAHYALGYYYALPEDVHRYHFMEAAKMGHEEALDYVLEDLFYRAGDLQIANPELAYEIFKIAKSKNPSIKLAETDSKIVIIKEAIEPGPFDAKKFIEEYNIKDSEITSDYGVWNLAAEASKGGRFGPPNPKLVLQLVSRGGWVPAETMAAVDDTYRNWKENINAEFIPCDYVTSGYGQGYCAGLDEKEANKTFQIRINELTPKLKNNAGKLLLNAFQIASKFIEEKAWDEEGSDGSGYVAWARESIIEQKTVYLNLVERTNKSEGLDSIIAGNNVDRNLNDAYQKVLKQLTKKPITDIKMPITADNVRHVQRLWIKYRDSSSLLLAQIEPAISQSKWIDWMTKIRTRQLLEILDYGN
jgi:uncharacterized protein YecT (DUF1311 family)